MNTFFEILDRSTTPPKYNYYARYTPHDPIHNTRDYGPLSLHLMAERVWAEDQGSVWYLKNRHTDKNQTVDKKEFLMIKLRCTPC